eukprot:1597467-Rhodomonas_salina.2
MEKRGKPGRTERGSAGPDSETRLEVLPTGRASSAASVDFPPPGSPSMTSGLVDSTRSSSSICGSSVCPRAIRTRERANSSCATVHTSISV